MVDKTKTKSIQELMMQDKVTGLELGKACILNLVRSIVNSEEQYLNQIAEQVDLTELSDKGYQVEFASDGSHILELLGMIEAEDKAYYSTYAKYYYAFSDLHIKASGIKQQLYHGLKSLQYNALVSEKYILYPQYTRKNYEFITHFTKEGIIRDTYIYNQHYTMNVLALHSIKYLIALKILFTLLADTMHVPELTELGAFYTSDISSEIHTHNTRLLSTYRLLLEHCKDTEIISFFTEAYLLINPEAYKKSSTQAIREVKKLIKSQSVQEIASYNTWIIAEDIEAYIKILSNSIEDIPLTYEQALVMYPEGEEEEQLI